MGCQKIIIKKDAANNPVSNFEIFYNDFNNYYAQFKIRHINWDSVYTVYRPQIAEDSYDSQLFGVMSKMVYLLNDMHVNLFAPIGSASWKSPFPSAYPSDKLINAQKYLLSGTKQATPLEYWNMRNYNIGYIVIPTFATTGNVTNNDNSEYLKIDNILSEFKNKDGIIIDVRWNGGGNSFYAETVASRFADKKRLSYKVKEKIGPGKNDFSDWINWYIEPGGNYQFIKPVVVLTSRLTSSSAETFVAYMNVLPQVTIVGDTTGGGSGNPIFIILQH